MGIRGARILAFSLRLSKLRVEGMTRLYLQGHLETSDKRKYKIRPRGVFIYLEYLYFFGPHRALVPP